MRLFVDATEKPTQTTASQQIAALCVLKMGNATKNLENGMVCKKQVVDLVGNRNLHPI
jgi:hypothetical protein